MKKLLLAILAVMLLGLAMVSAEPFDIMSLNTDNADPGQTASYTMQLGNNAADIASITCTSTELTYLTYTIDAPSIPTITNLIVGTPQTVDFTVTVPNGIGAGTYTSTINCTDGVDPTTETLYLTVNTYDAFTVGAAAITMEILPDNDEDESIQVTNTGSTSLTSFTAEFVSEDGDDPTGYMEDNDGDLIAVTFTNLPSTLAPGDSATITMNVDVDDDIDYGEDYEGIVTIEATGGAVVSNDIDLEVNLEADICEEGIQGDKLSITIDEPDNGDDFKPGEIIDVDIEIENDDDDDIDVQIELILWDSTDGEVVETQDVDDENIDDNDELDLSLEFELPTDVDEDHIYYLYAKVNEDGDEDDECTHERVRIDFERDDDDVQITSATISPSSNLNCGDSYTLSVEVESIGNDDQEDVFIEIVEDELDISKSTDNFDLGDHNDKDNDYKTTFSLQLPDDLASGTYYIDVKVYDKDGDLYDSELVTLSADTCSTESSDDTTEDDTTDEEELVEGVDIELILDQDYNVEGLDELTIPLIIRNNGEDNTAISLRVDDVSWGDVEGTEYLSNIKSGQSLHAYVYLDLETDVTGVHDLAVKVTDGTGATTTETIALDFGEVEETDKWDLTMWYWIVGIVVLVVILIILVRLLTK